MKKYILHLVYIVFLVLTLISAGRLLLLVVGDIVSGALSGRAETGWGILIATFLSPIVALFGVIAYYAGRKLKQLGSRLVISSVVAVLLAIGISVVLWINFQKEEAAHDAWLKEASVRQRAQDAPVDITRAEATALMNECKPKLFLYGVIRDSQVRKMLPHSKEGVILERHMGKPLVISVNDSAKDELLPLAQKADAVCEYFDIHELKP